MKTKLKIILFLPIILFVFELNSIAQKKGNLEKPRTIITTDGEIDDVDSFIRMLLHANEFKLEGLVYSSSMWHYKGDGKGTKMVSEMEMTQKLYGEKTDLRWPGVQWMQGLVDAYEQVYPKLSTHAEGFPKADYLRTLIKVGNIDFEGQMSYDTEGSNFIKAKLLDKTATPIYLQAWGGTNTIARALKSIEDQYKNTPQWAAIYKKVSKKAILFTILDQDATYRKYISVNWRDVKIYYNSKQFWCLAYLWKTAIPKELHRVFEGKFMGDSIINNHGPLTKMYYSYGDGQKQVGDDDHTHGDTSKMTTGQWGSFSKYDFISEGDSPAYLHLVNVGLGNLENPNFGGWGGRLTQSKENPARWEDGDAASDFNPFSQKMDMAYAQARWVEALQHEFAAHADWCVKDYSAANHPPKIAVIEGNQLTVKSGQKVTLNAKATDPDGNAVGLQFWQYQEAGTCKSQAEIKQITPSKAEITVPKEAQTGDTIHIIIEGKDNGTPALTRYQRVILRVGE